jgi:hypothetical protein
MAWITAERGGILENDSGQYNTIPVQRRIDVARPNHFRYYLTHGSPFSGQGLASARAGIPVTLLRSAGDWNLYEARRPALTFSGFQVVRWGQQWGELQVDQSVSLTPLLIAGIRYEHGLGTHTLSSIHLRLGDASPTLTGKVGLDDAAGCPASAVFTIFGPGHRELWTSGEMHVGEPAKAFSLVVESPKKRDLLLVAAPVASNACGHGDWVDLAAR